MEPSFNPLEFRLLAVVMLACTLESSRLWDIIESFGPILKIFSYRDSLAVLLHE